MQVGISWVNTWFLRDLRSPFGGVGLSGIGREGGEYSLQFYTEPTNVCVAAVTAPDAAGPGHAARPLSPRPACRRIRLRQRHKRAPARQYDRWSRGRCPGHGHAWISGRRPGP